MMMKRIIRDTRQPPAKEDKGTGERGAASVLPLDQVPASLGPAGGTGLDTVKGFQPEGSPEGP